MTDLWASRPTTSFSWGPATESMADFTDSELPQVEKNVCSAPMASAISSCARSRTPRGGTVVHAAGRQDVGAENHLS